MHCNSKWLKFSVISGFGLSLLLRLHLSLHCHLLFPIVHPVFCLPKNIKRARYMKSYGQLFDGSIKVLELVLTYLVKDLYATLQMKQVHTTWRMRRMENNPLKMQYAGNISRICGASTVALKLNEELNTNGNEQFTILISFD